MVRKTEPHGGVPKKSPFHHSKLSIPDGFNSNFELSNRDSSESKQRPQKHTPALPEAEAAQAEKNAAMGLGHRNQTKEQKLTNLIACKQKKVQRLESFQVELGSKLETAKKIRHRKDFEVSGQDWESCSQNDLGKGILVGTKQPLWALHHGVSVRGSKCDLIVKLEDMQMKYRKHVEFSPESDTNFLIKQIGNYCKRKSVRTPGS